MSRQLYKVSYKKGFRAFVMTYLECTTNILPPCPPYSGNAAHSLLVVSISYYINLLKIHLIYSDHSLPFSIDSKILPPSHPSNSGLSCFSLSLKNQTGKLKKKQDRKQNKERMKKHKKHTHTRTYTQNNKNTKLKTTISKDEKNRI